MGQSKKPLTSTARSSGGLGPSDNTNSLVCRGFSGAELVERGSQFKGLSLMRRYL